MCAAGRASGDRKAPSSQAVLEGGRVGRVRGSRVSCSSLAEGQQRAASAPCAPSAGGAPGLLGSKSPWEVSRHLVPSLPHQLHISMETTLVSLRQTNLGSNTKVWGPPSCWPCGEDLWGPQQMLGTCQSPGVQGVLVCFGGEWRDHL